MREFLSRRFRQNPPPASQVGTAPRNMSTGLVREKIHRSALQAYSPPSRVVIFSNSLGSVLLLKNLADPSASRKVAPMPL